MNEAPALLWRGTCLQQMLTQLANDTHCWLLLLLLRDLFADLQDHA